MQELVLNELKVYAKEVNSKAMQGVRQHGRKLGLSKQFVNIYSKRDPHPLSECSEYYLDDKEFIKKAPSEVVNKFKNKVEEKKKLKNKILNEIKSL